MRSTINIIGLFLAVTSVLAQGHASSPVPAGARFDKRTGILHWDNSDLPLLTKRDGEMSFTSSFGLMLERDAPLSEVELEKRSSVFEPEGRARTRDLGEPFSARLALNERGDILGLPNSSSAGSELEKRGRRRSSHKKKATHHKKAAKKSHKKSSGKSSSSGNRRNFDAIITWYTKKDLLNPYCGRSSSWHPTDHSMVAAPTMVWKIRPACGSFLRLTAPGSHKSIIVRVVDVCGGCKAQVPHVDLTLSAFSKLYNTNVGLVKDIQVQTLSGPPFSHWTPAMTKLYGPQHL